MDVNDLNDYRTPIIIFLLLLNRNPMVIVRNTGTLDL